MDAIQTLSFVALGGLLGAIGQALRAAIGIKKEWEDPKNSGKRMKEWFDTKEFVISFILGAIAGILAALSEYASDVHLTKNLLFGFLAAGYAGADFIGGLMKKLLPATK